MVTFCANSNSSSNTPKNTSSNFQDGRNIRQKWKSTSPNSSLHSTGYLERSALVESQIRRLIDDVKKEVADLRSELPPNEIVYPSSVDEDKKELSGLQAEISCLKNELSHERSAHKVTKQSLHKLETLIESLDKKIQVIIDQSRTQASIRVRIAKARYKLKAMLCLPRQASDKNNVQG